MPHPALDPRTAVTLGQIVAATERGARVARVVDHEPGLVSGTARNLTDEPDIRDAKLRVTLAHGGDVYWPVSELVVEVQAGLVSLDYRPRTPTERPVTTGGRGDGK